jgi:biopolymer transport protein ExbD
MAFARPAEDARPMSDLNTTPLIDVMLVLLIMFILTIPSQTHKIGIDLPNVPDTPTAHFDPVRNRVAIDAAGTIFWNGGAVGEAQFRALLAATMRLPVEPVLELRPAAEARYEVVDAVMADIKQAGVTSLGLPGNEAYGDF